MIQRRDVFIGIGVLAGLALVMVLALVFLSAVLMDDLVVIEDSVGIINITGPIINPDPAVKLIGHSADTPNTSSSIPWCLTTACCKVSPVTNCKIIILEPG